MRIKIGNMIIAIPTIAAVILCILRLVPCLLAGSQTKSISLIPEGHSIS